MKKRTRVAASLIFVVAVVAPGCGGDGLATLPDAEVLPADAARPADARQFPDAPVIVVPDAGPVADAPIPTADAPAPTADAPPTVDGASLEDAADQPDAASAPDAATGACFTAPGVTQVPTSSVFALETFSGATNQFVFNSNQCSDMPDSAERIYTFELTTPTEWYAETRCGTSNSWDCELVLTRNGCTDADVVACETTVGNEDMSGLLQAGRYALFLEGDNPEDPAVYDLMVNFNHTQGQADCASTMINPFQLSLCEDPFIGAAYYHLVVDNQMTTPSDIDDFFIEGIDGCNNDQDHIGGAPDKVYRLVLPASRRVEVVLEPTDWDGLLYITGSPCGAASSVVACSDDDVGSDEELDVELAAGTWYIVVDGFGEETFGAGSWGAFALDVRVYDTACAD